MATKKFHSQFAEIPMALLRGKERDKVSLVRIRSCPSCTDHTVLEQGVRNVGGILLSTYPCVRTCMGSNSGPYTQGTQLVEAPKMSMKRKKKATEAHPAVFSW
jgi:hypothetical protein